MQSFVYEPGKNLPIELWYPILISDIIRINGLLTNVKGMKITYNWGYSIVIDWDVVERKMYFSMPDGEKFSAEVEFVYSDKLDFKRKEPRRMSFLVCPVCQSRRYALYYNPFEKIFCCRKDMPDVKMRDVSKANTYYNRARHYCELARGEWFPTCMCKFPLKKATSAYKDRWTGKVIRKPGKNDILKLKIKFFAAQRKYFECMIKSYQKRSITLRNKKLKGNSK